MAYSGKIKFFFSKQVHLAERTRLKAFIEKIFRSERKPLFGLNYVFCSDKELLKINQDFLHHDFYTDIITFDLSEGPAIQGEIYISIERVRDNASKLGVSFKSELHRVIFHGALHLCGYRDKSKIEAKKMREKENFYLARHFN
jgi:probable rRNA maturation factor